MEEKSGKIIVEIDQDLADLIPGYLETRRQELVTLQKALEKSEMETIRIIGHTLKGSGGGYGFERLTEIGAVLEIAAKESNLAELQTQLESMHNYLERVEVRYVGENNDET